MALQDPSKKMSKSDENKNNTIAIMDPPEVIMSKFKKAVTDSDNEVRYSDDKPGVSNLLNIYCAVTGSTTAEAEREFDGFGYGDFKKSVGEAVVAKLEPVQKKFMELQNNKDYIDSIIKNNTEKARHLADRTLSRVQKKIGFMPRV